MDRPGRRTWALALLALAALAAFLLRERVPLVG
jgi:MYXO-CTERM domain-containing protein